MMVIRRPIDLVPDVKAAKGVGVDTDSAIPILEPWIRDEVLGTYVVSEYA